MNRRERLNATFQGKPVDRPAVSFYEIGGWKMEPDGDEFTVWNDPSWRPLVDLAHRKTDIIRMAAPRWTNVSDNGLADLVTAETRREGKSRFTRTTIKAPGRTLTTVCRRDTDVHTTWVMEHLLKDIEDAEAYLRLPEETPGEIDPAPLFEAERELGDDGIVSVECGDPICSAASLFSMADYTVVAMTEPALFHRLLERFARQIFPRCAQTAERFPGRLWRICGSEYASEPYLPPRLYDEYVVKYTGQMVRMIQKNSGWARIHSHGRLRGILPSIAKMAPDGMDPLEPPPQGDMTLAGIKQAIGRRTVLMGNIEASDIENLPTREFEKRVATALREGTAGEGRGFVLHPSASPYGRTITARTMANYETMVRMAETWG